MIRAEQLNYNLGDIKNWRKARDEYQAGIKSRQMEKGKHRDIKAQLYRRYQSLTSDFMRAGFQEEEIKLHKKDAYDFEEKI